MKFVKDKTTLIAAVIAVLLGVGGYFLAIIPQQDGQAELRESLDGQEQTNSSMETQIPALKSRLAGISSQVATLRSLSQRVPAQIEQAALYDQLGAIASAAGVEEITNLSVSVPQMVQAQAQQAAAPSADEALPNADGTDAAANPDTSATTPAPAAAVLASYDISMSVKGSRQSIVAFLQGLRAAPRINVVSNSSFTADEGGSTTLTVNTKMFLQQVDVDGLAQQIEELASSTAGGAPNATEPVDPGAAPAETGDAPASGEHPEAVEQDPNSGNVDTSGLNG